MEPNSVVPKDAAVPEKVIMVDRQTDSTKHRLLKGYKRLGPRACNRLGDIRDLVVLIKKDDRFWYTLQGETINDLLELADDDTRSLCSIIFLDLFGLTSWQYRKIKEDMSKFDGESGVWMKDEGEYAIVVRLPGTVQWYLDHRWWKGLATGAVVMALKPGR